MNRVTWETSDNPIEMLEHLYDLPWMTDRRLRLFNCAACRTIWELLTEPTCRRAVEVGEEVADGLTTDWPRQHAMACLPSLCKSVHPNETFPATLQAQTVANCLFPSSFGRQGQVLCELLVSRKQAGRAQLAGMVRSTFGNPWRRLVREADTVRAGDMLAVGKDGKLAKTKHRALATAQAEDTPDQDGWARVRLVQTGVITGKVYPPNTTLVLSFPQHIVFKEEWATPRVVGMATSIYQERDWEAFPALADMLQEETDCNEPYVFNYLKGYTPCVICRGTRITAKDAPAPFMGGRECIACGNPEWPLGYCPIGWSPLRTSLVEPFYARGDHVLDVIIGVKHATTV